ncbi:MAG: glycerate kinase [Clostridia bacterium]|jgi:glycerate kinase|nr:glycerate kinase [Clostridia bacterium]MCI2014490.1 glycerate kinase [Clostridia bacterium]
MKTVVAIDSLKGSLSSLEAGEAIKSGILKAWSDADVKVCPLADGGEGTVEALTMGMGGELVKIFVTGPMKERAVCVYGYIQKSNTAVIEVAQSAGINLVPDSEKNPLKASSYGVGENIKKAVQRGARNFIIGLGGSVTNDCGTGMLEALGYKFLDSGGNLVEGNGRNLSKISDIDDSDKIKELDECVFEIACDVTNPLCGKNGASYVFGFQKGADDKTVKILDDGCRHFAQCVKKKYGIDNENMPGAGAAGGLGYCFSVFFKSKMKSGIDIVIKEIKLEDEIKNADYVVTGEGRLDFQTSMGKAPSGVTALAKKYGALVIGIAGCATDDALKCNDMGMDAFFAILQKPMTLEEAMCKKNAEKNIKNTSEQIFRLIKAVSEK